MLYSEINKNINNYSVLNKILLLNEISLLSKVLKDYKFPKDKRSYKEFYNLICEEYCIEE